MVVVVWQGSSTLLIYTLSLLFLKEKLSAWRIGFIAMSLVGLACISLSTTSGVRLALVGSRRSHSRGCLSPTAAGNGWVSA